MKTIKCTKTVISLIIITFLFNSCIFIKPVQLTEIISIQIDKLSVSSAKMELNISIENPNFIDIKITSIDLDVFIENELLGKITEIEDFEIPANSNEDIKVKLDVSFSNLFSKAFKIVNILSQSDAKVKLSGVIETKALFVNKKIEVNEEDMVSLFK